MSDNWPRHVMHQRREFDGLFAGSVVGTAREPRHALELTGDIREPDDVAFERFAEARDLGVGFAYRQHPRQHLENTERLADLVADKAAEVAQLRRLPRDGFRIARDERVHRFLLQDAHGLLCAAQHQDRRHGVRCLAERDCLAHEERLEDLAENLILAQHLVHRGSLIEAQQSKLRRFRHHRGIGGDFLILGGAEVTRDFGEQLRNVIEQLRCRKDVALLDVEQLIEALEPCLGKRGVVRCEPRSKVLDGVGETGSRH